MTTTKVHTAARRESSRFCVGEVGDALARRSLKQPRNRRGKDSSSRYEGLRARTVESVRAVKGCGSTQPRTRQTESLA